MDYSQKAPQGSEPPANTTSNPNTSSAPTNDTTPSSQSSSTIIVSENMTWAGYPNLSIHYNITIPKDGGDIKGNFSGLCNGSINGRYNGGEGGSMLGGAWGSCNIPFLDHTVDLSYTGTVWPKEGKMNIDWLSHQGVTGENNGSFTQNFIPQ